MEINVKKLPIKYRPKPNGKIGVWLFYIHFADITYSKEFDSYSTRFLATALSVECKNKVDTDKMIRDEVGQFLKDVLVDDKKQPIIKL